MPTVVDSLIVTLGLDPANFNKGSKEAARAFLNTREEFRKTGKEVEASAKSADIFLGRLQSRALTLFAAFAGGKGLKDFGEYLNSTNTSVGRAASLYQTTSEKLSSWMGLVQATGGDARGAAASIGSLNNELQQMGLTGDSRILPYLRALGVSIQGTNGEIATATELLPRLATALGAIHDKARATAIGRGLGLSDDLIFVLSKGPAALRRYEEDQRRWGLVTERQTRLSMELTYATAGTTKSFETLGRQVMEHLDPAMTRMSNRFTDLFVYASQHRWVDTFFDKFNAGAEYANSELDRFVKIHREQQAQGPTSARRELLERGAKKNAIDRPEQDKAVNVLEELFFWAVGRENTLGQANEEFKKVLEKDRKARAEMDDKTVRDNKLNMRGLLGPLGRFIEWLAGPVDEAAQRQLDAGRSAGGSVGGSVGGAAASGGGTSGGGGAITPKQQQALIADDVAYLQSKGWRREQAIGIVANLYSESGGKHTITGDGGQAYGLAQWHPDRQATFERVYGKSITRANRQEQLDFVDWELRNTENKAGRRLLFTSDPAKSAIIVSKDYERPLADQEAARNRALYAQEIDRMLRERETREHALPPPAYGAPAAADWRAGPSNTDNRRSTSNSTTINGDINVQVPPGADGQKIGEGIKKSLSEDSLALHGEYGYL